MNEFDINWRDFAGATDTHNLKLVLLLLIEAEAWKFDAKYSHWEMILLDLIKYVEIYGGSENEIMKGMWWHLRNAKKLTFRNKCKIILKLKSSLLATHPSLLSPSAINFLPLFCSQSKLIFIVSIFEIRCKSKHASTQSDCVWINFSLPTHNNMSLHMEEINLSDFQN